MSGTFWTVGLLVVVGGITLLSGIAGAVRAWERRRPDPAWQPKTPVQKFSGYDQEKAVAAKHRALELEKSARKLAAKRSEPRGDRDDGDPRKVLRLEKKRRNE